MSLVTLTLHLSTVETKRRSEGGKLLRGSKTYDEIHVCPAEMDTWMCFQGARAAIELLGEERFRRVPSRYRDGEPHMELIDPIDQDWMELCGRNAKQVYQCCQADGQFVLVPRSKRVAYSAPFDRWNSVCYGRPHRFDKAAKVTDRTRAMWDGLTIDYDGFASSADPNWWPVYPDHVYKTRAPSLWKCSRCAQEHRNPHYAENWINQRYIDYCPHCKATHTPRFMVLSDLNEPALSFTERHPDGLLFWIGGEQIKRREKPVAKVETVEAGTPF